MKKVVVGTRTSPLALWQTNHIIDLLQQVAPDWQIESSRYITEGDRNLSQPLPEIGGKGLFTEQLEQALRAGEIDLAVHSLKDLPIESAESLTIGAIIGRADVRDALISPDGMTLAQLPYGAIVGTSSLRRQGQLLAVRPDLQCRPIRGNVGTRIEKVQRGEYDAAVLAVAGLERLQLQSLISERLPLELMLPAPAQGALGVQCRADDAEMLAMLAKIDCTEVRWAVSAERAFLHALGGGCSVPVGAYALVQKGELYLRAVVVSPDGSALFRASGHGHDPDQLGQRLAESVLEQGAGKWL